jgi:hypothetical protein
MRTLISLFFATISFVIFSQLKNFNTQRNWSMSKKEIYLNIGFTQFTGDLGGVNKPSSNYGIVDFKWPSTSWNSQVAYRFRPHPYWATVSKISFGKLRGNDALMLNTYQNSRNLNFRTYYLSLSQRIDLILFANEKTTARFWLGKRPKLHYQLYAFAGLGLLRYNPETKYKENWIHLKPLRTEGQGLIGGSKPYKRITVSIPLGIGYRWEVKRIWRIGFELEYIQTFSDYIDDVGGVYYDQNQLAMELGDVSAYLSNPSFQNQEWFTTGNRRGNKHLDGFFSLSLIVGRNITYKNPDKKKSQIIENEELLKNQLHFFE